MMYMVISYSTWSNKSPGYSSKSHEKCLLLFVWWKFSQCWQQFVSCPSEILFSYPFPGWCNMFFFSVAIFVVHFRCPSLLYTPDNQRQQSPKNRQKKRKGHNLNQTSIFGIHVNFPDCWDPFSRFWQIVSGFGRPKWPEGLLPTNLPKRLTPQLRSRTTCLFWGSFSFCWFSGQISMSRLSHETKVVVSYIFFLLIWV